MKYYLVIIITLAFSGCSSWNSKVVGKNENGNFWVKAEHAECKQWREDFDKVIEASLDIYKKAKTNSQWCLKQGPNDSFLDTEKHADQLYNLLKNTYRLEKFDKVKFNTCFGSNSYDFFEKTIHDSLFEYHLSIYNCSKEIEEIFKNSKSPNDFFSTVRRNLNKYFKRYEELN